METFNKVIPGKVVNEGIVSREEFPAQVPVISSPAHFPDFAMVTPKGPTKRATVGTGGFLEKFGDVTDPFGMYYNPISLAVQKLGAAGQASFSFKRLTNNTVKARVLGGVAIFKGDVPNYLRDSNGDYDYDEAGNPKVDETTPTRAGIWVCPATQRVAGLTPGKAIIFEVTSDDTTPDIPVGTKGKFYPFYEMNSGVGDAYNASYAAMGHGFNTDWNEVARFVSTNGAYPFVLNIGTLLDNGLRVPATTVNGSPDTTFTMFDLVSDLNVRYSLKNAVDQYTGNNVNRPVESREAPFNEVFMYQQNINFVCNELYKAEYNAGNAAPTILSSRLPKFAIMNPLDLVDHFGKPYQSIVFGGQISVADKLDGTRVTLNHYLQANGGINPFANADGEYPAAPTSWLPDVDGEWVVDTTDPDAIVSHKQCWEMNQMLILAWLMEYQNSLDVKDVIRNRSSFMWDVGYNIPIKEAMINMLSKRKDIIVVPCATEYLRTKTQDELYSTATMLNTRISMIPESETYKSHACRASINLWNARVIDEPTWNRFSLNLDTMYAFAQAGGSEDGRIYASAMPDHEGNRILRIMHDPLVEFEADDPAANNLINGSITVTPITESQFCRPALPTVYDNINSVLKDLGNVWKAVCVEKVLQDMWIQVSGDTQLGREGYLAFVKDGAEKRIRDLFGSVISNWEVVTSFREDSPTSKSVMYAVTRLWLGKGVYMMNSVLEAYNEDSLTAQ